MTKIHPTAAPMTVLALPVAGEAYTLSGACVQVNHAGGVRHGNVVVEYFTGGPAQTVKIVRTMDFNAREVSWEASEGDAPLHPIHVKAMFARARR